MSLSWKRGRLALIAVLTALAMMVSFAGKAFAAEPGESGTYNEEYVGSNPLAARGTMSEARNGGYLFQVWRGATNNIVWMSIDNGDPFQLQNPDGTSTATYVSPTVVPYGSNQFMVFHTGTDNNIYYTIVSPSSNSWTGYWTDVAYQSTTMSVSVAQLGTGSTQLYMVYRSSNDDRVWGTLYDGYGWQSALNINGGLSPSAPSVAYQPYTGLTVAVRGQDKQVWMSGAGNPYNQWSSWAPEGGYTYVSPAVVANQAGEVMVSYVDENSYTPYFRTFNVYGTPLQDWSQDISGWQTINSIFLSVVGTAIYAVLTGLNGYVYYKQVYNN